MAAVNVSIRMDAETKAQAEALFSELGLSFGAAVNVFVRQALRKGGLPFRISLGKKQEKLLSERAGMQTDVSGDYANLEEFFEKLDAG